MTRVLVLGDGTREMGALAEPECRRIIAAIDLAEQLGRAHGVVPHLLGRQDRHGQRHENWNWTAAVLRRIIEFTQKGGEINLVVDGITSAPSRTGTPRRRC